MKYTLDAAAISDIGRRRRENQDRTVCLTLRRLFAAIDGVGGSFDGGMAAQTLKDMLELREIKDEVAIKTAFYDAHRLLLAEAVADGHGKSGCVATAALLEESEEGLTARIVHAGDTRAYHLSSQGVLRLVTRDHRPFANDPEMRWRANTISCAVGLDLTLVEAEMLTYFESFTCTLTPGDSLILTTDGVSDFVDDATIARTLSERISDSIDRAAVALFEAALVGQKERNKGDNISAVLVHVRAS